MKSFSLAVGSFLLLLLPGAANAQHCPPIVQSFLSEISVKWAEDDIRVQLEYSKQGGARKEAYQVYLIAYLEKDAEKVPGPKDKDVLDPSAALVLHTQVIERKKKSELGLDTYGLEYSIAEKDLVGRVVKHGKLGEEDRSESGSGQFYKDRIRIAVFIPFLDDKKYSDLKGLPKDRHECNYMNDRALLFQTLPYIFDFQVRHRENELDKVWLRINGDKPEQ